MESYKIHAALNSESRSGDVWTYKKLNSRLIKIKNNATGKSIIVTNRQIEKNFTNNVLLNTNKETKNPIKLNKI